MLLLSPKALTRRSPDILLRAAADNRSPRSEKPSIAGRPKARSHFRFADHRILAVRPRCSWDRGDVCMLVSPELEDLMRLTSPRCRTCLPVIVIVLAIFLLPLKSVGEERIDSKQFSAMQWRLIGPFRGGRVTAVAGVPGDPNIYYFGTPGGGVWKTTDAGQVWRPIFDQERVASIGAMTVAPSDSRVIYAGTGEQTRGDGLYRSSDSGLTWNNVGLQDVPYIQAIVVDPQNPNVVVVGGNSIGFGILWRPIPKSAKVDDRGIFKTEDGGKTWKKVYANDDTLGVVDMCSDPSDPRILYAVVYRPASGFGDSEVKATSDIIKSSDGGSTWTSLESKGLPEKGRGRLGIAVAGETGGRRLYAILDQGFFRSDDGGATWQQSSKDPRVHRKRILQPRFR